MISSTSATVLISAHYAPSRVPFLSHVLTAILDWGLRDVKVILLTNQPDLSETPVVLQAQSAFMARSWTLECKVITDLEHPFLLTWSHRPYIETWLEERDKESDLFVYLEDDIVLTRENVEYFLKYAPVLRPHRLIPSFFRYEMRDGRKMAVDLSRPQFPVLSRTVAIDGLTFVSPSNPYCASYILDKNLGREFVQSRSFDLIKSREVKKWQVRERAAMGLAYEGVPRGFKSRHVMPLRGLQPDPRCMVWHCAQNLSERPDLPFGKLAVSDSFVRLTPARFARRMNERIARLVRANKQASYFEATRWD